MNYEDLDFFQLTEAILETNPGIIGGAISKTNQKPSDENEKELQKAGDLWMRKYTEFDRMEIIESSNLTINGFIKVILKLLPSDPFDDDPDVQDLRETWSATQNGYENDWISHFRRYYELIPPFVRPGTEVPHHISELYSEVRWCFIYGQYNACIALSRALIEALAKNKSLLKRADNHDKPLTINEYLNFFEKNNLISSGCRERVSKKIIAKGNKILHASHLAEKEEAKEVIEIVREFLEQIFAKKQFIFN